MWNVLVSIHTTQKNKKRKKKKRKGKKRKKQEFLENDNVWLLSHNLLRNTASTGNLYTCWDPWLPQKLQIIMVFWVTFSVLISPQLGLLSLVTNGKFIFETSSSSQLPTCLRQRGKDELPLKIYSRLEIKVNYYWRILPTQHAPLDSFQVFYDKTPNTTTSLNVHHSYTTDYENRSGRVHSLVWI